MKDDPLAYLRAARKLRALGEAPLCREMAAAAYQLAYDRGDGVLVYRSRACVGHLYYYRAEYEASYEWYRAALREAESWGVQQWIGPAHHDCWRSGTALGLTPDETNAYGAGVVEGWGVRPGNGWRFIHDHALRRDNGEREQARFLASAAVSASWHTVRHAPGVDEYEVYAAKFDRMVVYASMVRGYGGAGLVVQWRRALDLFDAAAKELGTGEGYALCLLEAAEGARRIAAHNPDGRAEQGLAVSLLNRAGSHAARRREGEIVALVERTKAAWGESPAEAGDP